MPKRGRSALRSSSRSRSRAPSRSASRGPAVQGHQTASYNRPKRGKGFNGKSLKSLVTYVKTNLPAPEKKYKLVTEASIVSWTAAGGKPNLAPIFVNGLTRGDTVQERAGDTINLGRGKLKGNLITTNGICQVRIMIVLDKKPNGVTLTNSELFNTTAPTATTFLNFNNRDVYSRYTILAEQVFNVDNIIDNETIVPSKCAATLIDMSWNCNSYVGSYKRGNAGTIADLDDGAVYICVQQSDAYGATTVSSPPACNFYGNYVQYFTDL